ncbi:MAG: toll/interleukin-1 receptor domain-containing protein [Candidatus Aminicenantes bacterium]|nr:toll/interleukin-1 receptor domain-containing protein [Candidatus Aminicenantes bacterium]
MAAIRYMKEQGKEKEAVQAIAKMLPEFWRFNDNANLIEDIFETIKGLGPTCRDILLHVMFNNANDLELRIALYMIYCVLVDKDHDILERLITAIKALPAATQDTLRKTYNELLDDDAFGWKYCTGQMPLSDSPNYVHLISERYRKLFEFQKAYNFDAVISNQTLIKPKPYTEHTTRIACWILIDPKIGRAKTLGRLHRTLGWYFENVTFIDSAMAASAWLLYNPTNTLIVIVGDLAIDRYRYYRHDLVSNIGALLGATSQLANIKERILIVLTGKELTIKGICHVALTTDCDDSLSARIETETGFEREFPEYERQYILPLIEELFHRIGFNVYLDGLNKQKAMVVHLRRLSEGQWPGFIILEDDSIRAEGDVQPSYRDYKAAKADFKSPHYPNAKLGARLTSVVKNLMERFTPLLGQSVDISVVYPPACKPASNFVLEAVLHLTGYELIGAGTHKIAQELTTTQIKPGARLFALLSTPEGFTVDEAKAVLTWTPPIVRVPFLIGVEKCIAPGNYYFKLTLYSGEKNPIEIVHVYFDLNVAEDAPVLSPLSWLVANKKFPRSAFASYSTKDWEQVKERVAALNPFMDVFVDCLDLKEGQEWEEAIKIELDMRDTFLLFWSEAARDSKWVRTEWEYVLEKRGIEYITPNSLVSPHVCPPPKELESLHFGSPLLLIRRS